MRRQTHHTVWQTAQTKNVAITAVALYEGNRAARRPSYKADVKAINPLLWHNKELLGSMSVAIVKSHSGVCLIDLLDNASMQTPSRATQQSMAVVASFIIIRPLISAAMHVTGECRTTVT